MLDAQLKETQTSAYALMFFAVHWWNKPFSYENITRANVLNSTKLWEAFQEFRACAPDRARADVRLQTTRVQEYANQIPLITVLMNKAFVIGPVVRVECALNRAAAGDFESNKVLEEFGIRAGELIMAMPEYLEFTPAIHHVLEEGTSVSRYIFPRQG